MSIQGQTLTEWMRDNPKPEISAVREIVEQISKGLLAFHRLEMLHQDLRPANIIDFGATKVAGIDKITSAIDHENILGTAQFTAPEYFLGQSGTPRSDLFSLAVITYQMLAQVSVKAIHC
jgi:serine/threonine protein kinase